MKPMEIAHQVKFFDEMIDLIPASYYYPNQNAPVGHLSKTERKKLKNQTTESTEDGDEEDKETKAIQHKQMQKKKQNRKQKDKGGKEADTTGEKAKTKKKTTSEETAKTVKFNPNKPQGVLEMQRAKRTEEKKKENKEPKSKKNASQPNNNNLYRSGAATSTEELRAKLQAKMLMLRGKRKIYSDNEAKRGGNKKATKRAKINFETDKKQQKTQNKGEESAASQPKAKEQKAAPTSEEIDVGSMAFSSLAKHSDPDKPKHFLKKKKKDVQLLKDIERKDRELKQLQKNDPEQAERVKREIATKTALKRLQGETVKDNSARIKKSLKKAEKDKKKSQGAWSERTKLLAKTKNDKLKKKDEQKEKRKEAKAKHMAKKEAKAKRKTGS